MSAKHTVGKLLCRWPGGLGFMAAAILLLSSSSTLAVDRYWQVAYGDWSEPANWSGGSAPTGDDNAYIVNGGTATLTLSGTCQYLTAFKLLMLSTPA
jgi:hypothetical protein